MSEALANFHFMRGEWLLLLLPLAWAVWRIGRNTDTSAWSRWCDRSLLPYILVGSQEDDQDGLARKIAWPRRLWLAGAGLFAILAISGPTWEKQPLPVFPDESALVILLSLSADMNVSDVVPNRLAQAKFKIKDLLSRRREGSVALVVYAGDAFIVSPLSEDSSTIEAQLDPLDSTVVPVQGQRAARALLLAEDLLDNAGHDAGEVLLVASGEGHLESAMEQAQKLFAQGRRLYVMGVGTTAGAPLPTVGSAGSAFAKGSDGSIIFSRREDANLAALAQSGGGFYRALGVDSSDLTDIVAAFAADGSSAGDEAAGESQETTFWLDRGAWLLLPLLPLAALGFRRGVLFSLLLGMVAPMILLPQHAYAASWEDLWQTKDQQAAELFSEGREAAAARKFKDKNWKGAALYKAGKFAEAELLLRNSRDVLALYIRANSLAQVGRYHEALGVYARILELEPGHKDARLNRDLVREAMRQENSAMDGQQGEQGEQCKPGEQLPDGQQCQQGEDGQGQQGQGMQSGESQQAQMLQEGEGEGEGEGEQGEQGQGAASGEDGTGENGEGEPQQYLVPQEESEVADKGEGDGDGERQMLLKDGDDGEQDGEGEQMLLSDDSDEKDAAADDSEKNRLSRMTPQQREQHMAAEMWMRNIKGNDSSFLKHKFQRQHQQRQKEGK